MLTRILLIYDNLQKLAANRTFDGSVLASAADIVRHFIEEHHQKLEEDFLFQHKAGRELTAKIKELAGTATLKYVSSDSDKLGDALRAFLHMNRPHEAREDTVLFPTFRSIVSAHE